MGSRGRVERRRRRGIHSADKLMWLVVLFFALALVSGIVVEALN